MLELQRIRARLELDGFPKGGKKKHFFGHILYGDVLCQKLRNVPKINKVQSLERERKVIRKTKKHKSNNTKKKKITISKQFYRYVWKQGEHTLRFVKNRPKKQYESLAEF